MDKACNESAPTDEKGCKQEDWWKHSGPWVGTEVAGGKPEVWVGRR